MRKEIILPQLRGCSRHNPTRTNSALDWVGAGTQLHSPVSGVFQAQGTGPGKWQVMCQLAEKLDEKESETTGGKKLRMAPCTVINRA